MNNSFLEQYKGHTIQFCTFSGEHTYIMRLTKIGTEPYISGYGVEYNRSFGVNGVEFKIQNVYVNDININSITMLDDIKDLKMALEVMYTFAKEKTMDDFLKVINIQ